MLFFASGAFLGPVITWCKYHRAHHRFIDTDKDPTNINRGFLHAHIGWSLTQSSIGSEIDVSDLEKDYLARLQQKQYYILAPLCGLVLPALIASLWGDFWGGFFYAGIVRIIIFQHAHYSTQSWAHIIGFQNYSNQNSSRNLLTVSFFTFGEGYRNFHHEFPKDYRLGRRFWDLDATKWILYVFSILGLVSELQVTKNADIIKARIEIKQKKLDKMKAKVDFGPEESSLPVENWASIQKRVEGGAKLVVVDGIIHDVAKFMDIHPGGAKILGSKVGKDATLAFNGSIYRHSKAARNLAAMMRVSHLPKEEIDLKVTADNDAEEIPTTL